MNSDLPDHRQLRHIEVKNDTPGDFRCQGCSLTGIRERKGNGAFPEGDFRGIKRDWGDRLSDGFGYPGD